jgi:hypothetical protein
MKQFFDALQKLAYDTALKALENKEPGLNISSQFRTTDRYSWSSNLKYGDPKGFHLGDVTTKAYSIYFDSSHETFNVSNHNDGFSFTMEEKHYINSSMKTRISFYAYDEKEEEQTREKIQKFLDKLMEGVTPEEGFYTGEDDLVLEDGIKMNASKTWAIIIDPNTKMSQNLLSVTGIKDKQPILVYPEFPITAIRALKAYIKQNADSDVFGRSIRIRETIYSASLIAEAFFYTGYKEIEFYQMQKDMPVGIKSKTAIVTVAPMISQDDSEASKTPTLDDIIAKADEILAKAEERKPTFDLAAYVKSRKKAA